MTTPRANGRPTLLALCRTIRTTAGYLPDATVNAIAADYPSMWNLVVLAVDRLANPTEAARARLEGLLAVVDDARVDHFRLWGPGHVLAWNLICGCTMTGVVTARTLTGALMLTLTRPDGEVVCLHLSTPSLRRATARDKALALAFYTTPGYRTPDAVAATAARQAAPAN